MIGIPFPDPSVDDVNRLDTHSEGHTWVNFEPPLLLVLAFGIVVGLFHSDPFGFEVVLERSEQGH